MPAPRFSESELAKIISKQHYGIASELGKRSVSSSFGKRPNGAKTGDSGSLNDVEPVAGDEQVGAEVLQIKCAGKVRVRIKFYRRRLADYSRAISEKAIIDALQYAGAIRGDSEKEIWLIDEGQEKVESKELERTEITLEYPEVDFDDLWEKRNRTDGR